MKKLVLSLLFFVCIGPLQAFSFDELPDEFYVNQHWTSYTTSFDVETNTKKLGTLFRRVFSLRLSYDFYDPFDNILATARARFFSIGAHFDVSDNSGKLLGMVEEKIFTFYPSFTILNSNAYKIAQAEMNFWGTRFTLSDSLTGEEMAVMSRSFFRMKNDWTIRITNRNLLKARNIDAKLLVTVLAFQGDSEYWDTNHDDEDDARLKLKATPEGSEIHSLKAVQQKMNTLAKGKELTSVELPNDDNLETIAKNLDEDYQSYSATHALVDDSTTSSEKFDNFTNFCFEKIQSNDVSASEKKAILYLMKKRTDSV